MGNIICISKNIPETVDGRIVVFLTVEGNLRVIKSELIVECQWSLYDVVWRCSRGALSWEMPTRTCILTNRLVLVWHCASSCGAETVAVEMTPPR
jgi:hypothetical protein